jgi:hypothetical protein
MKTQQTDFEVKNCSSLIMLYPVTKNAFNWINENLYLEDWQQNNNVAIEPRFFEDIFEGITQAGLTIKAA